MTVPAPVDPEIAAATFARDLGAFFDDERHRRDGWGLIAVDALTAVAVIPATRQSGAVDPFFVRMEAHWYDLYPPRLTFVEPVQGYPPAEPGSARYPVIVGSPLPHGAHPGAPAIQFALHPTYQLTTGETRQLLCFSHSFDYYVSGHGPSEAQRWTQGTHTLSASLSRLHIVLQAPSYVGPSSDHCP